MVGGGRGVTNMAVLCESKVFSVSLKFLKTAGLRTICGALGDAS